MDDNIKKPVLVWILYEDYIKLMAGMITNDKFPNIERSVFIFPKGEVIYPNPDFGNSSLRVGAELFRLARTGQKEFDIDGKFIGMSDHDKETIEQDSFGYEYIEETLTFPI
jgi:hypothetical protein